MQRELAAEFVGTFSLVTAVCGSALFSAPQAGLIAIALAVGLSVMAMAFAVAALGAQGETVIRDAECAGVSFPDFFSTLERLVER